MDLFNLHSDPKKLDNFDRRYEHPHLLWDKLLGSFNDKVTGDFWDDLDVLKKFKEYEDIWAKDSWTAARYAETVLKSRFPAGEPEISTNPDASYDYLTYILGFRAANSWQAAHFLKRVISGEIILKDGYYLEPSWKPNPNNYNLPSTKDLPEGINLFKLTAKPEELAGFDEQEKIPEIAFQKIIAKYGYPLIMSARREELNAELRSMAPLWFKDPKTTFEFARYTRTTNSQIEKVLLKSNDTNLIAQYVNQVLNKRLGPVQDYSEYKLAAKEYLTRRIKEQERKNSGRTVKEAINLYSLSNNPEQLVGADQADKIPEVLWDKLRQKHFSVVNRLDIRILNADELNDYDKDIIKYKHIFAKDPKTAFKVASLLAKPFPEGEAAIAQSAELSYKYAKVILGGRFPAGEAAMAKHPDYALSYATEVLYKRFPLGEAAIASNPYSTMFYINYIIKDVWPPGELALLQSAYHATTYCTLYKGVWPEAEPTILQHSEIAGNNYSKYYVEHVLKIPVRSDEQAQELLKRRIASREGK